MWVGHRGMWAKTGGCGQQVHAFMQASPGEWRFRGRRMMLLLDVSVLQQPIRRIFDIFCCFLCYFLFAIALPDTMLAWFSIYSSTAWLSMRAQCAIALTRLPLLTLSLSTTADTAIFIQNVKVCCVNNAAEIILMKSYCSNCTAGIMYC